MANFSAALAQQLRLRNRDYSFGVAIPHDPIGADEFRFSAAIHERLRFESIDGFVNEERIPIHVRSGSFLEGQDPGFYGFADGTTQLVLENKLVGASKNWVDGLGLPPGLISPPEKLSDVVDKWDGRQIKFRLLGTGFEFSDIYHITVEKTEVSPTEVVLNLTEGRVWNREIPITRLQKSWLPSGPTVRWDLVDQDFRHNPLVIPFGEYGRGSHAQPTLPFLNTLGHPTYTGTVPIWFEGYADPVNPAPLTLSARANQFFANGTFEPRIGLMFAESGPRLNTGVEDWQTEHIFIEVGDGRLATLGTSSSNQDDPIWAEAVPTRPVGGVISRTMYGYWINGTSISAKLPVFPVSEVSVNDEWKRAVVGTFSDSRTSEMFNGDLSTFETLRMIASEPLTPQATWAMGGESDFGALTKVEPFAIIDLSGMPAGQACLVLWVWQWGAKVGSFVQTDVTISAPGLYVAQPKNSNFDALHDPTVGFPITERARTAIRSWNFTYPDLNGQAVPMPFTVSFFHVTGSIDYDVRVHSAGARVSFVPERLTDQRVTTKTVRRRNNTAGGRRTREDIFRTVTSVESFISPSDETRFFVSGKGTRDSVSGAWGGTSSSALVHPVAQIGALLQGWGDTLREKILFDLSGPTGVSVTRVALNDVLLRLVPQSDGEWHARATISETTNPWAVAQEYMNHLPLYVYRAAGTAGQYEIMTWITQNTDIPTGYWYPFDIESQDVVKVHRISKSPVSAVANDIIVEWDFHSGTREPMRTSTVNSDYADDGFGNDDDEQFLAGEMKGICSASEVRHGRRTRTVTAPTVVRTWEASAVRNYFVKKYAFQRLEIELTCDIALLDIGIYQFVKLSPTFEEKTLSGMHPPFNRWGVEAWKDIEWRVIQKKTNLATQQVRLVLQELVG